MARYDKYGVLINATLIGGVSQQNLVSGSETRGEPSSGAIYPTLMNLTAQNPTGSFTTLAIAAALDALTQAGVAITGAGLKFYAQKYDGVARAAGNVHKTYLMNKGIIVPQTLSVPNQGDASLSCGVTIGYDGVNVPIVPAESQALAAGITDTERFTLGAATINGVSLGSRTSFEINFGIEIEALAVGSDIWPTEVHVKSIAPSFTIRGIDPDWFKTAAAIPLVGDSAEHANTTIYLRKRLIGGTFVDDATEEHISITMCGLVHPDDIIDAGDGAAETSLTMPLYHDGTNNPFVIDTTAALS